MRKMKVFIFCSPFGVLLCLLLVQKMTAECNIRNGPSGLEECVNFNTEYNGSQHATCLTNVYIQRKSHGHHACTDNTATYCWYQCMIEKHDVKPGHYEPVYDDCACEISGSMSTGQPRSGSTLPPWCLSPTGEDCSWYKQCLEKQIPCEGTPAAYAIKYAEKFCKLYTDYAPYFSQTGQKWINAVRKCLQVELAPNLRSWDSTSCEKIRQTAFGSHTECYLSPNYGEPSICELPCTDWYRSFWTLKSAFTSAFVDTLKGSIMVYWRCKNISCLPFPGLVLFHFSISRVRSTIEDLDELAGAVADAIASKLEWRDSGILWYAYSTSTSLTSIVPVEVLITMKGIYDLGSTMESNFSLTAVTAKVVKSVKDGDLFFRNVGDKSESIYVNQMKECADYECQQATQEVTAPPNRYTSSAFGLCTNFIHTIITFVFIFVIAAILSSK